MCGPYFVYPFIHSGYWFAPIFFAIVNNAAMNMVYRHLLEALLLILLDVPTQPKVESLDTHVIILFFFFF